MKEITVTKAAPSNGQKCFLVGNVCTCINQLLHIKQHRHAKVSYNRDPLEIQHSKSEKNPADSVLFSLFMSTVSKDQTMYILI